MKRLIVTGSRDVSYGLYMSLFLDLSGWLKFDRRANTTTGAGGQVGKRVFGGQGCYVCSWCPMIVIWRVCLFNVHTRRLMHCTCCRKRIEKQRPKLRTRRTVNCRNIGRWPIYCWFAMICHEVWSMLVRKISRSWTDWSVEASRMCWTSSWHNVLQPQELEERLAKESLVAKAGLLLWLVDLTARFNARTHKHTYTYIHTCSTSWLMQVQVWQASLAILYFWYISCLKSCTMLFGLKHVFCWFLWWW